jgi:excisionase family DNA binding protein
MEKEIILKPLEVAAILGVGRNTIYSILRRPDFPVLKLGRLKRVSQSALADWISKHTQEKGA